MKQEDKTKPNLSDKEISRRDALKKIGYTALTGSVMMVLLNTQSARATSVNTGPTNPGDTGGGGVTWDD